MWQKRIQIGVTGLVCILVASVMIMYNQHSREKAQRLYSKFKLKQLGLALSQYQVTFNGYPPGGVFDAEGRGHHGWMTAILPPMDQQTLYSLIDRNQPWDSVENAGWFLNHQTEYENPNVTIRHRHWEYPVAHYCANARLMAANSRVRSGAIDNQSAVFVVGELGGGFLPWGCPYNWRELEHINGKPPLYGHPSQDGCAFAYADGRVVAVANNVSAEILESMRGADLTKSQSNQLSIPKSFPFPANALSKELTVKDGYAYILQRDYQGKLVHEKKLGPAK